MRFKWPCNRLTWVARCTVIVVGLVFAAAVSAKPRANSPKPLQIYFVDVEGGQATLFVTPAGQSLLIDTGWPDNGGRDADRIAAAAKDAGISKLDFVLITHYHDDHVGGVPQLAAKIPIGTFIDHGPPREMPGVAALFNAYMQVLDTRKYRRIVAKPGDQLPIEGVHAEIVSSDGAVIDKPVAGAGQANAACAASEPHAADQTENARSLGTLVSFGKLRILDLGDLTWDKEMQLMCPTNKLGHIDIYVVSHHGWNESGSPALVDGIAPRVAIMDNGAKKGGSPSAWDIIEKAPGLHNLWQLHYSEEGGDAHNVAPEFIANVQGPDAGNYLKVTASSDGSFDVFNSRTKATRSYGAPRMTVSP
jgi:competence protein ComEC